MVQPGWWLVAATLVLGCKQPTGSSIPTSSYAPRYDRYVAEHPLVSSAVVPLEPAGAPVSCFGGEGSQYVNEIKQPPVEIYVRTVLDPVGGTYSQDLVVLEPTAFARYVLTVRPTEDFGGGAFGTVAELNGHYSGSAVVMRDGHVTTVVETDNHGGRFLSNVRLDAGGISLSVHGDTPANAETLGMTMPSSAASFGEMIKTFNDRLEKHLAAATGTPFAVSFVTATLPPIDAARCAELFTHFAAPARLW